MHLIELSWFSSFITIQILPALLNTEPYSDVIVTLFNRGEELLNEVKEKDKDHENEELIIRWTNVMKLFEDSIAEDSAL